MSIAPLTNKWVIAQQEPNVIQNDSSVVAVIKLDVDVFVVDVRVGGAWRGRNAGIQAAILLTPIRTETSSRWAFGC